MQARAAAIRDGTAGELVWLVEHPPLYTAGTSARPADLTDPDRFPDLRGRARRPMDLSRARPARRLRDARPDAPHGTVPPRDVRCFVQGLEEWLIRALDRFGVQGRASGRARRHLGRRPQHRHRGQIGAIGVRVSRWVSWHGVSLNVAPDLTISPASCRAASPSTA